MTTRPRQLPRPFTMPWGKGQIIQEAQAVQDHWEPTIQLMEYEDGSRALRFCTYSRGRFNRNPMMMGEDDIDAMRRDLEEAPEIIAFLKRLVD